MNNYKGLKRQQWYSEKRRNPKQQGIYECLWLRYDSPIYKHSYIEFTHKLKWVISSSCDYNSIYWRKPIILNNLPKGVKLNLID